MMSVFRWKNVAKASVRSANLPSTTHPAMNVPLKQQMKTVFVEMKAAGFAAPRMMLTAAVITCAAQNHKLVKQVSTATTTVIPPAGLIMETPETTVTLLRHLHLTILVVT